VLQKISDADFARLVVEKTRDAQAAAAREQVRAAAASLPVPKLPKAPKGDPDDYERRQAKYRRERRIADLGIPDNYRDARLSTPIFGDWGTAKDRADYAELCRRLAAFARDYGIVSLIGPRGTGKTHLAWATAVEAAEAGKSARIIKARAFFKELKETWGKSERTERGVVERYARTGFLAIDELSEARISQDWQGEELTALVDARYDARRPTLLIANDTRETFERNIGESILSRMEERGRIYVAGWPSVRTYIGAKRNG
jgi:DNA replication protein DnaC